MDRVKQALKENNLDVNLAKKPRILEDFDQK